MSRLTFTTRTVIFLVIACILGGAIPAAAVTVLLTPRVAANAEALDTAKAAAQDAAALNIEVAKFAEEACQARNKGSKKLRGYFRGEIQVALATDPKLYPAIPPTDFQALLTEKVNRLRTVIHTLDAVDCVGPR